MPIITRLWFINVLKYGAKYSCFWEKTFFWNQPMQFFYSIAFTDSLSIDDRFISSPIWGALELKGVPESSCFVKLTGKNVSLNFTKNKLLHRYFSMIVVLFLWTLFYRKPDGCFWKLLKWNNSKRRNIFCFDDKILNLENFKLLLVQTKTEIFAFCRKPN